MEKQKFQLQKAKNWNMASLIFKGIGMVFAIFRLPGILNPKKSSYELYDAETARKLYEQASSMGTKAYYILALIVSVIVFVLYFMNHQKLKNGILAPKSPYYIYLGWMVVSIVYSIFYTQSTAQSAVAGSISSYVMIGGAIGSVLGALIPAIPTIVTLVHVFKADTKE